MKIALDCRTALSPKTGDRTYTLNLLQGLARLGLDETRWSFDLLLDAPDSNGVLPVCDYFQPLVLSAPNSRLWTNFALPRYALAAKPDLVHLQYLAPPYLPCPFVTAIHDVVWRAYPGTFPVMHRRIMDFAMPGTARRAARIICGTQHAAHEIVQHLNVSAHKVCVTPYSVEPRYLQPTSDHQKVELRREYGIGDRPYILSVGVQQPRKNVARLIEAFLSLKSRHENWPYRLVITGKAGWGEDVRTGAGDEALIYTGYVEDDELPALYSAATVFAYPSLYEGFGLPILEAMACGTAVLTSDRGAMHEVAGDAAQLADPMSVPALMEALRGLLTNEMHRHRLEALGRERAEFFTVERHAQATLQVYEEVMRQSKVNR